MDTGKAPLPTNGYQPSNGGPRDASGAVISVQPPRREDLQPAYAQILQGESEDAGSHGWYGSMSMSLSRIESIKPHTDYIKSMHSDRSSVPVVPSPSVSSVRTLTNLSTKEMSASLRNSVVSTVLSILVSSRSTLSRRN